MSIVRQIGTRASQGQFNSHPPEAAIDRGMQQDPGMSKRVADNLTFAAATNRISGANGDFANFAVDDVIVIEGTNLNNGIQTVIGIDGVNQAYVTVDQGVKNEGPVAAVVRSL